MASKGLGSLTLQLILGLGGFTAPLDKAGRDLDKKTRAMQKRAYEFGRKIGVAMKAAAIGLAAVGTAAAAAIKGAIDRADEMSKAAQKVGLSTEAFSRLEYAATLADVSLEQLSGAIVKMTKFQAESVDKASEAAIVFTKLGVDAIDPLTGKMRKGEEVFRDFVGVLSKLDGPEKLAIGLKVFGKSFADLIPLINGGVEGLDRLGEESDRIGNTITTGAGVAAEEFNDQLETINRTLKGVALTAAAELLPQLKDMADDLQKIAQSGELVAKLESIFNVIGIAVKGVGWVIQKVVDTVQALTSAMIGLGLAAKGVLQGLSRNMEGAAKTFSDARAEMVAAMDAFDSGPKSSGGKAADNTPGGNIVFIDPPAYDASAAAAQKAAKEILDADNQIRDSAAKTAAAKRAQSKADSEAKKAAAEAAREQEQRERDLADAVEKAAQATADFKTQLEDLGAAGDPLAEAALSYKRELEDIQKLAREGEVSASDLAKAENLLAEAYAKTTAEIKERLDTGGQQLKQMQQELDLLNMQTDAERVRAQFLMDHPTATDADADAAVRIHKQIEETREAISAMDDFRSSFEDFVVAAANGKASFKDFADMVIQQIIRMGAAQLTASLFGQQGTTGGGWIGGLIGAFFGSGSSGNNFGVPAQGSGTLPGFATGTDFAPGGFALVGEHGPEIVNLPRGSQVTPNNRVGMGNTINITVQGNATRETAQQMANEVGRKLIFAGRGT